MIINWLYRSKLDVNCDRGMAVCGSLNVEMVWDEFYVFIEDVEN